MVKFQTIFNCFIIIGHFQSYLFSGSLLSHLLSLSDPVLLNMIVFYSHLFYLLDYGFLPQNVSEVGGKKTKKNFSVTRKYKSSPSAITAI
jgi:hypothetical protein